MDDRTKTFAVALTTLSKALNRPLDTIAIKGYAMALEDLSDEEIDLASRRALRELKFMPSPAELRALAGRAVDNAGAAALAWDAVRSAIQRLDYTASVDFGPLVNAVVRNLGGWDSLCRAKLTDLDVWRRKEFERVYGLLAAQKVESLHGEPLMGAFRSRPVPIAIPGTPQPAQLEKSKPVAALIGAMAEGKAG